jgi:hypothetical protein
VPLDDDQPKAGAARIRARPVAAPEELGEELALLLRGHADARVVDHHLDRPVRRRRAHAHRPRTRVLDRVRDQVPEHLDEAIPVAHDRRQVGQRFLECESMARGLDPEGGRHLAKNAAEGDQLLAELDAPGLDLGDVEEVVDQGPQPVRALGRHLQEALLEFGHRPPVTVEHQLHVATKGRQRGPELMRDRRDELVLHPFDCPPLGHVPHDHDEGAAAVGGHGADRQLGGEPRAVLATSVPAAPRAAAVPPSWRPGSTTARGRPNNALPECP